MFYWQKIAKYKIQKFSGSIEIFINFKEITTRWLKKEQNYEDKWMEILLLFLLLLSSKWINNQCFFNPFKSSTPTFFHIQNNGKFWQMAKIVSIVMTHDCYHHTLVDATLQNFIDRHTIDFKNVQRDNKKKRVEFTRRQVNSN